LLVFAIVLKESLRKNQVLVIVLDWQVFANFLVLVLDTWVLGLVLFATSSILEQLVESVPRKWPMHSLFASHSHGPVAPLNGFLTYFSSQTIIPAISLFTQPLETFRTKPNGYSFSKFTQKQLHCATLSDSLQETLVFLKCNAAKAL
jgi:hypothetical protein